MAVDGKDPYVNGHGEDPYVNRGGGSPNVLAGLCGGVALRDLTLVDSRRNAEKFAGSCWHEAGGASGGASPVVDVIRAAMLSIEQYPRSKLGG